MGVQGVKLKKNLGMGGFLHSNLADAAFVNLSVLIGYKDLAIDTIYHPR